MTAIRPLQVVIGASLVAAVVTGRIDLFVRPWFVPVVVATGLLLLFAAARSDVPHRVGPVTAGLLLLPVLAGAVLTPGLVGRVPASAGADGGEIGARLWDDDNPLLAGAGGPVTLLQVVLAERQLGAAALDGRPVVVEAMVTGADDISRQVMVCCAADARPLTLSVRGPLPPVGTWVRVTGTLAADGSDLVLVGEDVVEIPTPRDPLL